MCPGQTQRRTRDDVRRHDDALRAYVKGRVIRELHRCRRASELLRFKTTEENLPPALDLHLILDTYGTHTTPIRGH